MERNVMAKDRVVFGIYPDQATLETAVDALRAAGFRASDISAVLPERVLERSLLGRPRPTSAEREAYRELFLFAGIHASRVLVDSRRTGDTQGACRLLGEMVRVLDAYNPRFALFDQIKRNEAALAKQCGLVF